MKNADSRHNWNSFATGYLRTHWALAVVQKAWVACLLVLATVIAGSDTAFGQDLPDTATPGSAIWTGDSMITWGGYKGMPLVFVNVGWSFDLKSNIWTRLPSNGPLSARSGQVAVWTGKEMLIWSGTHLNDGARYNAGTGAWTPISPVNAPSGRDSALGFWTGSRMLVWGGDLYPWVSSAGGQYDPVTDAWFPMSKAGQPQLQNQVNGVWTGTEMIVWGGIGDQSSTFSEGARYNPATDTWKRISSYEAPSVRISHAAIWTGKEMIIWGGGGYFTGPNGGISELGDGGAYDPITDTWRPLSKTGAPSPRRFHSAVWTGSEMIVWGGFTGLGDGLVVYNDGAAYNPSTDTWRPLSNTGAPSVRFGHYALWTGSRMLIWSGHNGNLLLGPSVPGGGAYDPMTDAWTPITDTLNPKPTFVEEPRERTVLAGQPVSLSVTVQGASPLAYQWYLESTALSGATNSTFSIPNAQLSDAGLYSVVAGNSYGMITSTSARISVIVEEPIQIVTQPQDQRIVFRQPLSLSVVAQGTGPLRYQWRFYGDDIVGATNSTYTIPNCYFYNSGPYSVVVRHPYESVTSRVANVTVFPGVNPTFKWTSGDQQVIEGHPANFEAYVNIDYPSYSYQWLFGTNIISGATNTIYNIGSVQTTNAGIYTVVATDAFGESASASMKLTVTLRGPLDLWTPVNSGTTNWLNAVAMNRHTVVIVGNSGTIVTSTNGVDWVSQVSGVTNNLNAIVYANGLFVAGGDAGTIVTSPDGIAWTRQRSNTTDAVYGLAFGNGVFVVVGANGLILNSPDGMEWTYHPFPPEYPGADNDLLKVAFGNGIFIAYHANWFLSLISSNNGADWVVVDTSPAASWWLGLATSLVFDNGYFYCLGEKGFESSGAVFCLISADGTNWWGGYFKDGFLSGGATGVGNGQVLVTVTGSRIETADIVKLNADRPIWNYVKNDPEYYPNDYFTFRGKLPVFLASLGFWHSRFVGVGEAGAIYLSGTLPPYLSQISHSGDTTSVSVEGIPLESYVLQSAAALSGPWRSVSTNSTSADGIVTFSDPTPPDGSSRFYRVSGP